MSKQKEAHSIKLILFYLIWKGIPQKIFSPQEFHGAQIQVLSLAQDHAISQVKDRTMSQKNLHEEDGNSEDIKKRLRSLLIEEAASHKIEERDLLILSLRLGLKSEKCYTLVETGRILHLSPECIRQRQHFLLRKKIKNPLFFEILKTYAANRKLPLGFELDDPQ